MYNEEYFWEGMTQFQEEVYNTAKKSGFHLEQSADPDVFSAQVSRSLMLIISEASEAFEDLRKGEFVNKVWEDDFGKLHGIPTEIADIVIRCFDFAQTYRFDLGEEIKRKAEYNKKRPYRHGNKQF